MNSIHLFGLTSQHNAWLSARQSAVAQNIANASTPDFKALDVKPFSQTLNETRLDLGRTSKMHFSLGNEAMITPEVSTETAGETLHSGNNVSLEHQFEKSGEIARSFALNVSVLKSFNRMLLMSSKG